MEAENKGIKRLALVHNKSLRENGKMRKDVSLLLVELFPTSMAEAEREEEVGKLGLMETSNPHTSTSALNSRALPSPP